MLVKALPQPSRRYGETVCCAGVTAERRWKRLFPIRFRHLNGSAAFRRWDWVSFRYRLPTHDPRPESCHVNEDTIEAAQSGLGMVERARFLEPLLRKSARDAADRGESLALIRPRNTRFVWKRKERGHIEAEREAFGRAARQFDLLDEPLAAIEPTPYHFRFRFEDDDGRHDYANGDWEAHAMFWKESDRVGERKALDWMDHVFNEQYPQRGMAFALGNQAKRPQTWQLLGVLRLDAPLQDDFGF
ncbi:MAG TPA: hypothetical protein VIL72_05940 [Beijerinckiaceae bacterium]|jgi:hypothetical protein